MHYIRSLLSALSMRTSLSSQNSSRFCDILRRACQQCRHGSQAGRCGTGCVIFESNTATCCVSLMTRATPPSLSDSPEFKICLLIFGQARTDWDWELGNNTDHFRCLTSALTCDSCELEQDYFSHFLIFLPTKSELINSECWQAQPVSYKYNIEIYKIFSDPKP